MDIAQINVQIIIATTLAVIAFALVYKVFGMEKSTSKKTKSRA